jgi:flagellar basal-body rod modification protein FlgD
MAIDTISSLTTLGQASADNTNIAGDFDAFLQILTSQLQNQNPLDPLDTNQFTQQLVQFAGVEQSIKQNENLEALIQMSAASTATAATSFIGKKVMIQSTVQSLEDGKAEWSYYSDGQANGATYTIRDDDGNVVWTETKDVQAGRNAYVWNGRDNDGNLVDDGKYSLTIEALDETGDPLEISVEVAVTIDGIDFSGEEPILLVGEEGVPLSQVRAVLGY